LRPTSARRPDGIDRHRGALPRNAAGGGVHADAVVISYSNAIVRSSLPCGLLPNEPGADAADAVPAKVSRKRPSFGQVLKRVEQYAGLL
jgi:hypothetical protein